MGFGVLLLVIMALLAWGGRRHTNEIVLPENTTDTSDAGDENAEVRQNTITINPETVGNAVSILARPETYWSGGSGQTVSQVYVSGGYTRLDTTLPDGSIRHTLVASGEQTLTGVWYDDETHWTQLGADGLTADAASRMLTYETVRDLPPEAIASADYRQEYDANCIFVETEPDGSGYRDRYWVSVGSGLLIAAERLQDEDVVYRFSAGEPEISPQDESLFQLPDGGTLE